MLERLEKARKPISILFMIIINCVLVGSLIYLALFTIPEYQKKKMCHEYFLELKDKAGIYEIDSFDTLNETDEIIKIGTYLAIESHKIYNERLGIESIKLCACVCNESQRYEYER